MRKILLTVICIAGFLCQVFLAIHFSDKILDVAIPQIPSVSLEDAIRNGRFIAKLDVDQESINQRANGCFIEESWIEAGFRPKYEFPFGLRNGRSGYNYCFKMASNPRNPSKLGQGPVFVLGDRKTFGTLKPSRANKSLYFTNLSFLKPGQIKLLSTEKNDPELKMVCQIGIDYFDAAFHGQKKADVWS